MKAENIKTVVVIGGGTLGQGIAQSFAEGGLSVRVVDLNREILDRCLDQIDANLRLFQEYGLLEEDLSSIKSRIHPVLTKDLAKTVQDCDFVVEAIPEDLELKRQLFAQLDSCPEEVILASNTSSLTVSAMAQGCRTASRIVGLHYYNPAHIMPLVEIHFGPETSDEVIATTKALMLRVGKKPVIVRKEITGFIVNRLQAAMMREMMYLVNEGVASPEDIDTAYKASIGIRFACIGMFEFGDWIGLDFSKGVMSRFAKSLDNSTEPAPVLLEKVKRGELGVKSGRGWYDWTGRSREEIIDSQNRRLIPRWVSFKELEKQLPLYKSLDKVD